MAEPYATGSGSIVNVATSRDREATLYESGETRTHREQVLTILQERGTYGLTGKELRTLSSAPAALRDYATGTSTLTGLYVLGEVEKLTERRGRGFVYVHPDFVAGRDTQPYVSAHLRRFTQEERELADLLMKTIQEAKDPTLHQTTLLSMLRKMFR